MGYFNEDKSDKNNHNIYLSELSDICLEQLMLSSDAYTCMIKMNLHGYKRLHRHLSKKFHDLYLTIQSKAMESTGMPAENNSSFEVYKVKDLKEHLHKWNEKIEEHLKIVSKVIRCIFEEEGYICCIAQDIQKCLFKNLIKNERTIQRFCDCDWSPEIIYYYDDKLHKKIKQKEEDNK